MATWRVLTCDNSTCKASPTQVFSMTRQNMVDQDGTEAIG